MAKKKVLLTGASGSMGGEAFKELLKRRDKYDIVLFLLPGKIEKKRFSRYEGKAGFKIVWGDLRNADDVMEALSGVDHVLHTAGFISPAADKNPPLCKAINVGAVQNLVSAIRQQPFNGDNIRFVGVGSVGEYGDRLPPYHMVQVGDPLKPVVGDFYGVAKMEAEKTVIESGLKYWAWMRQTYIAIPNALSLVDPIMFHQPLNTHIELITAQDAGYGIVQTLEAPDDFYGRVYNMSGGPSCRVVFQDYLERMMKIFGVSDFRKVMSPNWFALRNFHCCWYEDSCVLNDYLGHWRHSLEDHYRQVEEATPWYVKLGARLAPSFIIRMFIKRMADPLKWVKNNETEKIKAFFGSREIWKKIPDWDKYNITKSGEDIQLEDYSSMDVQQLAKLRGGEGLSTEVTYDRMKLMFKCRLGHQWNCTAALIKSGHWCPECAPPPWNYDAISKTDPLLAKFYYNNHSEDEQQRVEYLWCPND